MSPTDALPKNGVLSPAFRYANTGAETLPAERLPRLRGLMRSELRLVFLRPRTAAMLGFLALVPVLLGVALRYFHDGSDSGGNDGGGGALDFVNQVTGNGLFLVFASLAAALPFFLPMTVGVVAGDSIAGEANSGTLRYLLVAPAGRTRLLLVKFGGILAFCLAATLTVALTALVVGAVLFPMGDVPLLTGDTISMTEASWRAVLIALCVAASLVGLAAIGLFVSTLTTIPVAAMATTVGVVIVTAILTSIPQLSALHPWLFTDGWLSFGDLLRNPVPTDDILRNLGLQAAYTAVFGTAAWSRIHERDITT
ncbi:ABC transporter permease subunit [Streptomyces sp. SID3343]|uniref:ABC transporter permease n=1 Tax=Streptomyces sp. SID3343 TaxID=2690260 RepID=UPI00136F3AD2|nr:ABC transporter permease subunit [Streptomyces sp. SID3343]MYW05120.1 ABC transporter permease subunit [Streptomyces sp. SID3343]